MNQKPNHNSNTTATLSRTSPKTPPTRNELHRTFAGEITANDFNGSTSNGEYIRRISITNKFDKQCATNCRIRDSKIRHEAKPLLDDFISYYKDQCTNYILNHSHTPAAGEFSAWLQDTGFPSVDKIANVPIRQLNYSKVNSFVSTYRGLIESFLKRENYYILHNTLESIPELMTCELLSNNQSN